MSNSLHGHSEPPLPPPTAHSDTVWQVWHGRTRKSADLNPASHLWEELGMQISSGALSFNIGTWPHICSFGWMSTRSHWRTPSCKKPFHRSDNRRGPGRGWVSGWGQTRLAVLQTDTGLTVQCEPRVKDALELRRTDIFHFYFTPHRSPFFI